MEEISCNITQEARSILEKAEYNVLVSCIDIWYPVNDKIFNSLYGDIAKEFTKVIRYTRNL